MSFSRSEKKEKKPVTMLKEDCFAEVIKLRNAGYLGKLKMSNDVKIHFHIPVCIGLENYAQSYDSDELLALITAIEAIDNTDYTVYLAPWQVSEKGKDENFKAWEQNNTSLLDKIQGHHVLEDKWRENDQWKSSKSLFDTYTDKNNKVVGDLLNTQDSFTKNHLEQIKDEIAKNKESANKAADDNAGQDEGAIKAVDEKSSQDAAISDVMAKSRAHNISCVVDCISWMTQKPVGKDEQIKRLNVLVYPHVLGALMKHVIRKSEAIVGVPKALTHINPSFSVVFENNHAIQPVPSSRSMLRRTTDHDQELSAVEAQAVQLLAHALHEKNDPLFLAKAISNLLDEFQRKNKQFSEPNDNKSIPAALNPVSNLGTIGFFSSSSAAQASSLPASASAHPPQASESPREGRHFH